MTQLGDQLELRDNTTKVTTVIQGASSSRVSLICLLVGCFPLTHWVTVTVQ